MQMDAPVPTWFALVWLGVLGAILGSFFNVVIYRLPRGISLVHPPSQCPKCGRDIRWYHNIPVLGWIWLRGRCRDCGAAISPRYPIVEALTAALFVLLAWAEIFSDAAVQRAQSLAVFPSGAVNPWAVYVFHLVLLCTLLCLSAMEYDGARALPSMFTSAFSLGMAAPILWPALRPFPLYVPLPNAFVDRPWLEGLAEGVCGVAGGALFGALARPVIGRKGGRAAALESMALLALAGAYLGWQATSAVAAWTAVLYFGLNVLSLWSGAVARPRWPMCVAAGTAAWLLAWASYPDCPLVMTRASDLTRPALSAMLVASLGLASTLIRSRSRRHNDIG